MEFVLEVWWNILLVPLHRLVLVHVILRAESSLVDCVAILDPLSSLIVPVHLLWETVPMVPLPSVEGEVGKQCKVAVTIPLHLGAFPLQELVIPHTLDRSRRLGCLLITW